MARRHLAIFLRGTAEKILKGEKKIEIRLSKNRSIPYLSIAKNDEILLKNAGGNILGKALVDNVLYYDCLSAEDVDKIKENYAKAAGMNEDFWRSKKNSKFATVIFLKKPEKFLSQVQFKKNDRRPWLIIDNNKMEDK